jgi:hypothetical protein
MKIKSMMHKRKKLELERNLSGGVNTLYFIGSISTTFMSTK